MHSFCFINLKLLQLYWNGKTKDFFSFHFPPWNGGVEGRRKRGADFFILFGCVCSLLKSNSFFSFFSSSWAFQFQFNFWGIKVITIIILRKKWIFHSYSAQAQQPASPSRVTSTGCYSASTQFIVNCKIYPSFICHCHPLLVISTIIRLN